MSEDSDQEKTEEPTSKRLEDARKKGQIARSREFNTFVMLMTSAVWWNSSSFLEGIPIPDLVDWRLFTL